MICFYTVNKFCKDDLSLIENYDKAISDKTQTWQCHHRLETDSNLSCQQLKDMKRYFNVPANELIFLTKSDHMRLHNTGENNPMYENSHSEEAKRKISDAMKGKSPAIKGKHHSEETKKKLSDAHKGKHLSEEHKRKLSDKLKGRVFTKETKQKLREVALRRWHPELYK